MEAFNIQVIEPKRFFQVLQSLHKPYLVDVRSLEETQQYPAPVPAYHFNLEDGNFNLMVHSLDKRRAVIVFCQDGKRAKKACRYMALTGFERVYCLKGGLEALNHHTQVEKA